VAVKGAAPYGVDPAGLMRCCIATLQEDYYVREIMPEEGHVIPCKYCSNKMIFRDEEWGWLNDASRNTL
jgi:hypothetical protein